MTYAVVYCRASTPRQGKSRLGIEAQEFSNSDFCRVTGIVIVKWFYEILSGKLGRRPELDKAIRYCREHGTTLVIAMQNRLARNIGLIHYLMESGIKFISADKPHATKYDIYRQAIVDEEESETISIRTKAALQAAKRRGVVLGKNATKLVEQLRQRSREHTLAMVPVIEKLKLEGFVTEGQILTQLRRRRIRPLRGPGYRWHPSTVHYLLKRIEKLKSQASGENHETDSILSF